MHPKCLHPNQLILLIPFSHKCSEVKSQQGEEKAGKASTRMELVVRWVGADEINKEAKRTCSTPSVLHGKPQHQWRTGCKHNLMQGSQPPPPAAATSISLLIRQELVLSKAPWAQQAVCAQIPPVSLFFVWSVLCLSCLPASGWGAGWTPTAGLTWAAISRPVGGRGPAWHRPSN